MEESSYRKPVVTLILIDRNRGTVTLSQIGSRCIYPEATAAEYYASRSAEDLYKSNTKCTRMDMGRDGPRVDDWIYPLSS